jgi:hypothetical protein
MTKTYSLFAVLAVLASCHNKHVVVTQPVPKPVRTHDPFIRVDDAGNYLPESFLEFLPRATLHNVMSPSAKEDWEAGKIEIDLESLPLPPPPPNILPPGPPPDITPSFLYYADRKKLKDDS